MDLSNRAQHSNGAVFNPGPPHQLTLLETVWAEVYMTRLRQMSRSLAEAETAFQAGMLRGPPRSQIDHAESVWNSPQEPLSAFAMYVLCLRLPKLRLARRHARPGLAGPKAACLRKSCDGAAPGIFRQLFST